MKIGIIGAMEEEVTLLRDKIENRQTITIGGSEIYTGQLHGVDVALLTPGDLPPKFRAKVLAEAQP
ncbi:hypothetical protein AAAA52_28245, partial [Klebsiella pneumoniae]|uniref:phosphorylase family protein n=1 Tax=Klebsiella pneumoniae TaxID=573 RepID=UPI0034DA2963